MDSSLDIPLGINIIPDSSLSEKKQTGSFYTPSHIARMITENVLLKWLSEQQVDSLRALRSLRVLDPSVGDGAFLIEAGEHISELRIRYGDNSEITDIRREIVERNLYGVDLQESAAISCQQRLASWIGEAQGIVSNIEVGNSLLGPVRRSSSPDDETFSWSDAFPEVFTPPKDGFDIVLGNPPYGNLLSKEERDRVRTLFNHTVFGGRDGSWNVAPLFIVRASELLNSGGHLGFLIPNSILRVKQFRKTREFILNSMNLYKIIDEGNPFEDVTLEMVSVLCKAKQLESTERIEITSKRPDLSETNSVLLEVFKSGNILSLYHDQIFESITGRGNRGLLQANRGRDIPHSHVRRDTDSLHSIPYATSGRSIKRYSIDTHHLRYTDYWFLNDKALTESYQTRFLVATKNYPYPRCIMKPQGVIHGGGIVRIRNHCNLPDEAVGLILNSSLVKYICIRYLTNYSELTTCLNTGILEDLPLVIPRHHEIFTILFNANQTLSGESSSSAKTKVFLNRISDALVYSIYFDEIESLEETFDEVISEIMITNPHDLFQILSRFESEVNNVFDSKIVKDILNSPRM